MVGVGEVLTHAAGQRERSSGRAVIAASGTGSRSRRVADALSSGTSTDPNFGCATASRQARWHAKMLPPKFSPATARKSASSLRRDFAHNTHRVFSFGGIGSSTRSLTLPLARVSELIGKLGTVRVPVAVLTRHAATRRSRQRSDPNVLLL